jgi:hypothetical protein
MSTATITPASFSTPASTPTESQPPSPEFQARQTQETADLFDEPAQEELDLTGGGGGENEPEPTPAPKPKPTVGVPPTPTPEPQQPQEIPLTDAMAESLKKAFPHLAQQPEPQVQQPAAPMSDEEFAKHTNHFAVNEDLLNKLDSADPKERVTAYNQFVDGIRKNVVTLAYHMLNDMQAQVNQQFVQQQKLEKFKTDFHTAYPSLSDPSLEPIIEAATVQLKNAGRKFPTHADAYKAIAELAAQTIKAVKPEFDLSVAPTTTPTKPSKTTMPKANGSPSGGGGGAGGNAPSTKVHTNVSNGVDVFE